MHATGGLFAPVFGQPPSLGRWCWCLLQMGFKSAPFPASSPCGHPRPKTDEISGLCHRSVFATHASQVQPGFLLRHISITSSLTHFALISLFSLSSRLVYLLPSSRPLLHPHSVYFWVVDLGSSSPTSPPCGLNSCSCTFICQHLVHVQPARASVPFPRLSRLPHLLVFHL